MTKNKSGGRNPVDENALFRSAMSDTKPLDQENKARASVPQPSSRLKERWASAPKSPAQVLPASPSIRRLEAGSVADLDRRTMDKLRRGRLRPEARIDLHGMTVSRAHCQLNTFISRAHGSGNRCVLVITGKGSLKKGGGVIRRELPAWLNSPENRPCILGFSQAQPSDGGSGAFYVLLKRRR